MDEDVGQALVETARDISSIRDTDLLFAAIAERARRVLGTDMAYVSLNDPTGDSTAIRATAGVHTDAYARIAMPLGTGVLGLAAGGSIVRTDDYLADTRRIHLADVDDAVREEGVRAIAGVPLTIAGTAMGALMVADRTAHGFTDRQMEDLTVLGHQAAVAAELHRGREQLAELRQSRQRLRFLDAAHTESSAQTIADSAARIFGIQVAVFDDTGNPLTAGSAAVVGSRSAVEVQDALRGAEGLVLVAEDVSAAWTHGVAGESGFVVTSPPVPAVCIIDIAGAMERALLRQEALAMSRQRSHQELLSDLLSFSPGDTAVVRRAAAARITQTDVLVAIAVITPPDRARATANALRTRVADKGIVSVIDAHVCAVLRVGGGEGDAFDQARAVVTGLIADDTTVGCAAPVVGLHRVGSAMAEARTVAAALQALGRSGVIADPDTLGVAGMLLGTASAASVAALIDRQLGRLLRLEGPRAHELTATLRCYFDVDESVARTAEMLGLHVNTVRQRLDRLNELIGSDWRTARRLDVHVALIAETLRSAPLPPLTA